MPGLDQEAICVEVHSEAVDGSAGRLPLGDQAQMDCGEVIGGPGQIEELVVEETGDDIGLAVAGCPNPTIGRASVFAADRGDDSVDQSHQIGEHRPDGGASEVFMLGQLEEGILEDGKAGEVAADEVLQWIPVPGGETRPGEEDAGQRSRTLPLGGRKGLDAVTNRGGHRLVELVAGNGVGGGDGGDALPGGGLQPEAAIDEERDEVGANFTVRAALPEPSAS